MVVKCEQVWQEVSNYLEGEVNRELRAAMDEHFRTCQRCTSVLEGTRNVVRLYGDERMIEVPTGFSRRLEKKLAQGARVGGSRWSTWSTWLVPVAALALVAGGLRYANSLTVSHPLRSEHAQPAHAIPPDLKVVVTADAKLYHLPGCDVIHNKDKERTLTAREAEQEGYSPCVRCLRKYVDMTARGLAPLRLRARADSAGLNGTSDAARYMARKSIHHEGHEGARRKTSGRLLVSVSRPVDRAIASDHSDFPER